MKRLILSFSFIFSFLHYSYSQNPLVKQWDKRFGGTSGEVILSFQQTADKGYFLAGWSVSGIGGDKTQPLWGGPGDVDYWIVKIDSLGNKQWDKDFGGTSQDLLFTSQQTADKGYILGGPSSSGVSGDKTQPLWDTCATCYKYDYWIVKIDSLGNKEWDKDFGGTALDVLYSLQQTMDGGYILGGYSYSDSSGDKTQPSWGYADYWIVKTDSLGNKQWDKRFGGASNDWLESIKQTPDGGYILAGNSYSDSSGDKTQNSKGYSDYWIIKTDSLGNKQWDKDFGGTDIEDHPSIYQTADGGYIIQGQSFSNVSGDKTQPNWDSTGNTADYWIIKTDSLGTMEWDKDFGGIGNEGGYSNNIYESESIVHTPDGGYLIAGTSSSNISGNKTENKLGNREPWLVKTDSAGNFQWDKTIFVYGFNQSAILAITNDGCYAIANCTTGGIGGYKTQPKRGSNDYWMVKFCDTTATTSITQLPQLPQLPFSIYPNPATQTITLKWNKEQKEKQITINDLFGREVFKSNIYNLTSTIEINISFLSPGIYFLKAGNEVKKFVKE
ncbi:MAG: T9SS type A sorting domain-containing protein [Bacteroidota bacterium]